MYLMIRMPLACCLILVYTFLFYATRKRLRTATARAFELLMLAAAVHLLAEVVTEYTVNNRDVVSPVFNYVWHLIFLISLTCVCGSIYYYLLLYVERGIGRQCSKQKRVLFIVCCAGILAELVLPITYVDTPYGSYSYGPKAYALYCVVIYSMVMLVITSVRYRLEVGKRKSNVMLISVSVFVVFALIQIVFPYILLTGLAVTMIVLGIMINAEDVNQYLAAQSGLYNEFGCCEILQELHISGRPFSVGVYVFLGNDADIQKAMDQVAGQLPEKVTRVICGDFADNVLVVVPLRLVQKNAKLPKELPALSDMGKGFQYKTEILHFDHDKTVEQIAEEIRHVRTRYEEDILQRDDITGLLRRKAFEHQVEHLMATGQAFSFMMIDLDDFKSVNDTYGHDVGDHVLECIARVLRKEMRSSDIICRMGGDEFAIVLWNVMDRENIEEIAHRILQSLEKEARLPDESDAVKLSIGVKQFYPDNKGATFQQIYAQADAALYHAKYKGKAQVAFAGEEHTA